MKLLRQKIDKQFGITKLDLDRLNTANGMNRTNL